MDLSRSPAVSTCSLPNSSCQVMVKGRSTGAHRVAALQSRKMISRSTNWYRVVGETVTGRAGTRTSRLWSGLSMLTTVEVMAPESRKALWTCSRLALEFEPLGGVRGGAGSRRMNSTACSSNHRGCWSARSPEGGVAGGACHQSIAPPPATTPSTKASAAAACCRHWAGSFWSNGDREGPNCSVSGGCCAESSSQLPTFSTILPGRRRFHIRGIWSRERQSRSSTRAYQSHIESELVLHAAEPDGASVRSHVSNRKALAVGHWPGPGSESLPRRGTMTGDLCCTGPTTCTIRAMSCTIHVWPR